MEENTAVTATRTCANDADHVETESVPATGEVTRQPTCTEAGETNYTSGAFGNPAFTVQNRVIADIEPIGHAWSDVIYAWNDDNTAVTAVRTCARDEEHIESETVPATGEITKQSTCSEMGENTYTSGRFENADFAVQSKTLTNVDALCHDWDVIIYTWSDDHTTVTASRKCINDVSHTETETVSAHRILTLAPTNDEPGTFCYVSEAFINEAFTAQQIEGGTIPALGTLNVLQLPADLTVIHDEAFGGLACQAVIIPDGCITIGNNAFAGCANLVYVYIPASVQTIADDAFSGCPDVFINRAGD